MVKIFVNFAFFVATDLDSDTWVAEVKSTRGKKLPLTAVGVQGLRAEYGRTLEPARALVNQTYGLSAAEIALMWKTAPPRMPIPPSACQSLDKNL